jgi:hypothetical protein
MADEVQINSLLALKKENVDYRSLPSAFKADVAGSGFGPYPGLVQATTAAAGVEVDLTVFTTPGYFSIHNIHLTNFVEYGIHDGSTFHPLGEVLPGEIYPGRMSRNVLGGSNTFRVKGNTTTVPVIVDVFEA